MTEQRNYRRTGAYALMILSAFSMMVQYGLQGVLASGHATNDLPELFWQADWALWALRALIEAVVILYLFETDAQHKRDRRLLNTFEAALIMLITATIAPALRAQGLGLTMPESVSPTVFTLWCVGLAAYTPLMMGGLATALRVQPGNEETVTADTHAATVAQLDNMRQDAADLRKRAAESAAAHDATVAHNRELVEFRDAVTNPAAWNNATTVVQLMKGTIFTNGNMPKTKVTAHILGVGQATVSAAVRKVTAGGEQ